MTSYTSHTQSARYLKSINQYLGHNIVHYDVLHDNINHFDVFRVRGTRFVNVNASLILAIFVHALELVTKVVQRFSMVIIWTWEICSTNCFYRSTIFCVRTYIAVLSCLDGKIWTYERIFVCKSCTSAYQTTYMYMYTCICTCTGTCTCTYMH